MLALRVIDPDHGEFQIAGFVHRLQADDARCGLLTASQDGRDQLLHLCMDHVHQIAAVVNDDIGSRGKHRADVGIVLLLRRPVPCMNLQPRLHQRGRHIILGGKRIGTRYIHLCPACCQHLAQISRLCLQMYGKGDLLPYKWFRPAELFFQHAQQVTVSLHPFDFLFA